MQDYIGVKQQQYFTAWKKFKRTNESCVRLSTKETCLLFVADTIMLDKVPHATQLGQECPD